MCIDVSIQVQTRQCFLFADPLEEIAETSPQTAANSAAELLKQGAGLLNFFLAFDCHQILCLTDCEKLKLRLD